MKFVFRKPVDIFIALIWTVIAFTLAIIDVKGAIRVIFGLPFVIFIPGYVLTFALFPGKRDIDIIERIALSFGLSIAVVPLVGLILNYTPFGIRLEPIVISLSSLVFILSGIGLYRWYSLHEKRRFTISFEFSLPENRIERVLTIALIFAIVASICLLIYIIATPRQGEKFTEFYILGPEGKAEGYPTNLTIGEKGKVIIGIVNHEGQPVDYTVETWLLQKPFALYFDGVDDYVKVPMWSNPFSTSQTIEAWVKASEVDTVYSKSYQAEDYAGETGEKYTDNETGTVGRKAIAGIHNKGYICDEMVVPKGFNGPFALTVYSKVSDNTIDDLVWKAEVYENGTLKWSYEMKANEYRKVNEYQWKESPTWMFNGSNSYLIKIYWYGCVDLYVDRLGILARRGVIGKVWPHEAMILFTAVSTDTIRIGYYTQKNDGNHSYTWFSAYFLRDGKYHHIAVTLENGTKKCYVDGEPRATMEDQGDLYNGIGDIYIGGGTWRNFFGNIDDVRIYNRALTAEEIYQNYLGNVTLNGLVSWWKFDEGVGKVVHDCINDNDGTIYGATWTEPRNITPKDAWFMGKIEVRLNSTPVNIEEEWQPQWEYNYTFSINKEGVFKLAFLLFKGKTEDFVVGKDYPEKVDRIDEAYRECHLWVTVK